MTQSRGVHGKVRIVQQPLDCTGASWSSPMLLLVLNCLQAGPAPAVEWLQLGSEIICGPFHLLWRLQTCGNVAWRYQPCWLFGDECLAALLSAVVVASPVLASLPSRDPKCSRWMALGQASALSHQGSDISSCTTCPVVLDTSASLAVLQAWFHVIAVKIFELR